MSDRHGEFWVHHVQLAAYRMSSNYKMKMIMLPIVKVVAVIGLVIIFLNLVPYVLENGLNNIGLISDEGRSTSIPRIPFFLQIFTALIVSLPLVASAVKGVSGYRKWKNGESPPCPDCRGPMVQRTAMRGTFKGQKFWGCITYPACQGKEHIGW